MKDYIKNVKKTESAIFSMVDNRIRRLLHGAMGCSTESGELLDTIKKYLFYGKKIDFVNVKEEIGDLLYYIAIMIDELDTSFEEIMKKNIEKLKARYGEKFSEDKAINRDLNIERNILEQ